MILSNRFLVLPGIGIADIQVDIQACRQPYSQYAKFESFDSADEQVSSEGIESGAGHRRTARDDESRGSECGGSRRHGHSRSPGSLFGRY
jgi:hypothetical protein